MQITNSLYREDLRKICKYISDRDASILITGATGLIGSCITDAFVFANLELSHSHEIYVMGRNKKKLEDRFCYGGEQVHYLEQDAQMPIPDEIDVNYVISAASNADPRTYALYPAETILTNVLGNYNALEYAKRHNSKVLMTSTMEVYGEMDVSSKCEDSFGLINFNSVRSGYPESKRTSELLFRSYVDEYHVEAMIARLGYIYGPTMSSTDNKVVAQFIRKIINKENIVLKSEGKQKRSYCYVADTVAGIVSILFNGKPGEAYNIASSKSTITIKDMAQIAADIAGTKVVFDLPDELERKGSSTPQNAVLCVEKLKSLGWEDSYGIEEGFRRTEAIMNNWEVY